MLYLSRAEQLALLILLGLLLTGAGLLAYARARSPGVSPHEQAVFVPAALDATSGREITVSVSGAVVSPGIYHVRPGALAQELLEAAGGFDSDADRAAVDLTAALSDGDEIVVPAGGLPANGASAVVPAAEAPEPISLNAATAKELEALPGIGPVYAQRIIAYREKSMRERGHGFLSTDELLNVRGIGPKRLAALGDKVVP